MLLTENYSDCYSELCFYTVSGNHYFQMCFFKQLIYSRYFSGKSDADTCMLFSDCTLINRRNVTGNPHSSNRANRDFLYIIFKSRVITAAMKVLGFTDKSSEPANYKLPENMKKMRKTKKLNNCLQEISAKVVDEFVFNSSAEVNGLIDRVLTEQEKDILQQQELTPDGRFRCRFPSCTQSFKYNGKARRSHELSHDPPVEIDSDPTQQVTTSTPMTTPQDTKPEDDVFNYNCSLLTDCFLFFNFQDAIKEGDGVRVMRQYRYFMLNCKVDGSSSTKFALECLYQFFSNLCITVPKR